MNIENLENNLVARIERLREDIEAIQQPRSNFALKHFVVGMHDMPGRQRQQAVLELQIKMFNIRRGQLAERETLAKKRKAEKDLESEDIYIREMAQIEIERCDVDIAELKLARIGAAREAEYLLAILDALPRYTYEDYQREEAQYWRARLSRQALQDMKAMGTVSAGNQEAIRQMFREPGSSSAGAFMNDEYLRALTMTEGEGNE